MCKTTRYHRKNIPLRGHELTGKVYVVVNFLSQVIFIFLLFKHH